MRRRNVFAKIRIVGTRAARLQIRSVLRKKTRSRLTKYLIDFLWHRPSKHKRICGPSRPVSDQYDALDPSLDPRPRDSTTDRNERHGSPPSLEPRIASFSRTRRIPSAQAILPEIARPFHHALSSMSRHARIKPRSPIASPNAGPACRPSREIG